MTFCYFQKKKVMTFCSIYIPAEEWCMITIFQCKHALLYVSNGGYNHSVLYKDH